MRLRFHLRLRCWTVFRCSAFRHASMMTSLSSDSTILNHGGDVYTDHHSLRALQKLLKQHSLAAYLIPTSDAHQSEYVCEHDKRRQWITGFTGSAGTAVVLAEKPIHNKNDNSSSSSSEIEASDGYLFTDGRYFLQAEKQLDEKVWKLVKQGQPKAPKISELIAKSVPLGSRVGVDPFTYSAQQFRDFEKETKGQVELVATPFNMVDAVWGKEQPAWPANPIRVHPIEFAGETLASKVRRIREKITQEKCGALVVSALDDVAWIFNLRGSDIECNPVFFAYAVITLDIVRLYVDSSRFEKDVMASFDIPVEVRPYDAIIEDLKAMHFSVESKVWLDHTQINHAVINSLPSEVTHEAFTPVALMKAVKNEIELKGFRESHIRDGCALVSFLSWLNHSIANGDEHDEVSIADKLEEFRAQQKHFVGLSFDTISGSGPNGAIIHYRANKSTARRISSDELLLLDSGAQYYDGTTDVTRTFHLGRPSEWQRHVFTRVLQGHISLATATFPSTTAGPAIDCLARQWLWQDGLDYMHGTGHGVGSHLAVHEGPHGISHTLRPSQATSTALQSGMLLSNEPGYYEAGAFGVRIESLVIVKAAETPYRFGGRDYLCFETITMCPIDRKMIVREMLTTEQLQWLNNYHRDVYKKLSPLVSSSVLEYLREATQPL